MEKITAPRGVSEEVWTTHSVCTARPATLSAAKRRQPEGRLVQHDEGQPRPCHRERHSPNACVRELTAPHT